MKRSALCTLVLLSMVTGTAAHPDPGTLGIFFDPAGTVFCGPSGGTPAPGNGVLAPFVPFDIYVISFEVAGGQDAYEFSIDIDPRVTPTVETFFPAGSSDFGVDDGNFKNYLVGTGGTCYGDNQTEILVQWQALLFANADVVLFCLGAASPSSFSPERPGYLACNSPGDLRVYGAAYEGCAVGNALPPFHGGGGACSVISTESSTWGALKARY